MLVVPGPDVLAGVVRDEFPKRGGADSLLPAPPEEQERPGVRAVAELLHISRTLSCGAPYNSANSEICSLLHSCEISWDSHQGGASASSSADSINRRGDFMPAATKIP